MPLLYRGLRYLLQSALELYYVDIQSTGNEHVPAKGPLVFAANHPNSVMDTVVLGSQTSRTISYMARSGLFDNPLVSALFHRCGVIPVYRRQDGPADPKGNQDAFRAAYEVLEQGGAIGIFPEGQNAPERHVRDIKTGTARIALGAEARNDYELGVQVVPVGLSYSDRDRFLTRVLVRFGPAIDARDFAAMHREDERAAVRALTDAIQDGIRDQAVHVHDLRHEQLVTDIHAIYGGELVDKYLGTKPDVRQVTDKLIDRASGRSSVHVDLDDLFTVKQHIADAVAHYEREQPHVVRNLEKRLRRFREHLVQARLKTDFAETSPKTLSARREAVKMTLYAVLLAPIALWGLVHNFVPYRITRRLSLRAPDEAIRAITAFFAGMLVFGLTYSLYAYLTFLGTESWWAVATYMSTLPIAGFWFLRYRRQLERYNDRILVRTLFRRDRRLLRSLLLEREQLLMELEELAAGYAPLVASSDSSSDSSSPEDSSSVSASTA